MPKTEPKTAAQNPVEVPLYTPWDAARYLHVPLWGLFALTGRFRGWPEPDWFFVNLRRGFPHPLVLDDDLAIPAPPGDRDRISFRRFADLFVRAATLQALVEWSRAGECPKENWENFYHAIWRGLEDNCQEPVAFGASPPGALVHVLTEPYARRLDEEQLALLRKWFALRLERVEVKDGVPVRIYPFSRDPAGNSPRIIVLDPRVRFGRPTLAGRGVPTDILFERYQTGDSVAELAEDYDLPPAEVEEAIRYEALSPVQLFPFYGG